MRKLFRILGVDEAKHFGKVAEVANHLAIAGYPPAHEGKNIESQPALVVGSLITYPSEKAAALPGDVIQNKLAELINDRNCIFVALPLRLAPSKQAVTAEHN